MKTKLIALAIGIIGILVAGWGISTLRYYRSFTETTEGVMDRRDGKEVVIRFHEERTSPAPQKMHFSGNAEYAFPLTNQTETLKVGDKVKAYHPPGRLSEARLDKDFPYLLPVGWVAAGAVLMIAAAALFFMTGRKPGLPLQAGPGP